MNRAGADRDVDVAVGDDAGETLGDAAQFDGSGRAGRVDGALSSGKGAALGREGRRRRR
jgi:hypothetical protein